MAGGLGSLARFARNRTTRCRAACQTRARRARMKSPSPARGGGSGWGPSSEPHQRQLDGEPGTKCDGQYPTLRSAALQLLEHEEDAGARGVAVAGEHRSRGGKGVRMQVQRAFDGVDDARATRVPGNRVEVRQAEAGFFEERLDRAAQVPLHHIRKLAAENHAKPTVSQLVAQMA